MTGTRKTKIDDTLRKNLEKIVGTKLSKTLKIQDTIIGDSIALVKVATPDKNTTLEIAIDPKEPIFYYAIIRREQKGYTNEVITDLESLKLTLHALEIGSNKIKPQEIILGT